MATTTIDKYKLEIDVSGKSDVDNLNKSVSTLNTNLDSATKKKLAISINSSGFDTLSNNIKDINTSLNNISTKIVKPTISIAGLDQITHSLSQLNTSISTANNNLINVKTNDSQVKEATNSVQRLGSLIDTTDNKTISIKANAPTSLIAQNIDELKSSFASLSTGLLAGGVAAAIAGIVSLGTKSVETAGAITDLSEASGLSASEIYSLGDSIINAGGAAGQNYDVINKLSMSIEDAANNGGKAAEAFKTLNVPIKDTNGKMRDTSDILVDVLEALGKTEDKTTRLSTAQELLGKANRNLKFEDIKFTDDAKMNQQISNTDSLGAAFDKLMQAVNKVSMATVSSGADDAAGKVGTLTEYVNRLTSIFNFATEKSDTFGGSLVDLAVKAAAAVNPLMAMVDLWKKGETAVKYLRENIWQNKSDPLMAGNADAIKSNPLGQSKGYQGRIKPFEVSPPKYDDSRFGVKPPKGGAGADAAAAEAARIKLSREASDAELEAMSFLYLKETELAALRIQRIGLNKEETDAIIEQAQIEKTMRLDLAKVDAEITKEKQKGADTDQYIIGNLKVQRDLIISNAAAQSKLSDARADFIATEKTNKDLLEKSIAANTKTIDSFKPDEIPNKNPVIARIEAETKSLETLATAAKTQLQYLKDIGDQYGYNSEQYVAANDEQSVIMTAYNNQLVQQKSLVDSLTQAEKTRTESFAGGWEDAMRRMNDAMAPAQLGAQAYNDLWGNISSSIDTAVTTGKFKFADFRDSIISDLAKMASKALASKFTSWLLGSFTSPLGGYTDAIGGDKGGSAFTRASGGSVSGNQPYLVGERGPELFMPGKNGTIIPNRNLNEDKPQVVNTYNYNISAIDGNSVAKFFMDNKTMVAAANNAAKRERG